MNHQIMQSELYLLLSNPVHATASKQELETSQTSFYAYIIDQIGLADYCYAHRLLSIVEGKFRTLREEFALLSFESEKKCDDLYPHHQ